MDNRTAKDLCLSILRADSESDVVDLLSQSGLWDAEHCWRLLGDEGNNWSTVGNQGAHPDAALVEKIVNAVDARLLNECRVRQLDPESRQAPLSIGEAVAEFFSPKDNGASAKSGRISSWPTSHIRDTAMGITVAATGYGPSKGDPCITIADQGEGQTPDDMPTTLLSINKSNKQKVHFVQGKFNMGGTGVLRFAGKQSICLVMSRRNPTFALGAQRDSEKWGFTVIRREDPAGGRRSSWLRYLAPVDANHLPNTGRVLRFASDSMPIFPDGLNPYGRESLWGTAIKVYEYSPAKAYNNSNILRRDGLLSRLDILLPAIALPVRVYECRPSITKGENPGSFATTLSGLVNRLEDSDNLEEGFPDLVPMKLGGFDITARIYAFKEGRADTYKKREGIIFTVNGQTQGHFTSDFFRREKVKLHYLRESILVVVDCASIIGRANEDLFMNSRDRLADCELRVLIEKELEDLLRHHQGLRELQEKRRREEIAQKLADDKPLEEILSKLIQDSPALANLFSFGTRLGNPLKSEKVGQEEKQYEGERFPTFFKLADAKGKKLFERRCPVNQRARLIFETDAVNDYFGRAVDRGEFSIRLVGGGVEPDYGVTGPKLHNGSGLLSIKLPESLAIGTRLHFRTVVTDKSRIEPIVNDFVLVAGAPQESTPGGNGNRKPRNKQQGDKHETPPGIALPKIVEVKEDLWEKYSFDRFSGVCVKQAPDAGGGPGSQYDFFVNVSNVYLQSEQKRSTVPPDVLKARYTYGLVLIGLAIINEGKKTKKASKAEEFGDPGTENAPPIEDVIAMVSRACTPLILPMVDALGSLDADALGSGAFAGDT